MLSFVRLAGILTGIFAVCGPAAAQALAPAGSGVTVHQLIVENGLAHTVRYFVSGGSPRLHALVRRVEWAENELIVVEQLQMLKLDTVMNERRIAAFRTAQLTNPYYAPGFFPYPLATDIGYDGAGSLQRALKGQLAVAATPEATLQLIGFLELMQTELDAELKALPPQEQQAVQGPIDALRPRLAALPRGTVPPSRLQPVASRPVPFPTQAVPPQRPTPPDPVALQQRVRQDQEKVRQQIQQMQPQMKFPAQAVPKQLPLNPFALHQMMEQQFLQVQQVLQRQ
jgi:hypothetical protein